MASVYFLGVVCRAFNLVFFRNHGTNTQKEHNDNEKKEKSEREKTMMAMLKTMR
jgi:hypothetical protein